MAPLHIRLARYAAGMATIFAAVPPQTMWSEIPVRSRGAAENTIRLHRQFIDKNA
jgi:hypothetical protein